MIQKEKQEIFIDNLINALGGFENILSYNSCVSKLRYDVKDNSKISISKLNKIGIVNINFIKEQNHIQLFIGPETEKFNKIIKELSKKYLNTKDLKIQELKHSTPKINLPEFVLFNSVADGQVLELNNFNDNLIKDILKEGFFIKPRKDQELLDIYAPFNGSINLITSDKTRITLNGDFGQEIIMIFGIDSYKLNGFGIDSKVSLYDKVLQGQKIITLDLKYYRQKNIIPDIIIGISDDSKYNFENFKKIEFPLKMFLKK